MRTPILYHLITPMVAVGFLTLLVTSAQAQLQMKLGDAQVDKVERTMLKTPEYTVDTGKDKKTPRRREWLELEVEFEADAKAAGGKDAEYIDQLLFKYYVMVEDKETKEKIMLTTTVTHVNIPTGEKIYSAVYLSPSSLDKMVGKGRGSERSIEGYAVEIIYGGVLVGGKSDPSGTWFKTRPGKPGLLLTKDKTPFAPLWGDRYAEIQQRQN